MRVLHKNSGLTIATKEDIAPKVGIEIDSKEEAYLFYNMYARYVGFNVHKKFGKTKVRQIKQQSFLANFVVMKLVTRRKLNGKERNLE